MSLNTGNPILNQEAVAQRILNTPDVLNNNRHVEEELEIRKLRAMAALERYTRDTKMKSGWSNFVMIFTWISSIAIFLVVILNTNLSDSVRVAFITQALATIIGLPMLVVKHLFYNND